MANFYIELATLMFASKGNGKAASKAWDLLQKLTKSTIRILCQLKFVEGKPKTFDALYELPKLFMLKLSFLMRITPVSRTTKSYVLKSALHYIVVEAQMCSIPVDGFCALGGVHFSSLET